MTKYETPLVYDRSFTFFNGLSLIRDFKDSRGNRVTFGYMLAGKYIWKTVRAERFTIYYGRATFVFNDITLEATAKAVITIPKETLFEVHVEDTLDYRCDYD